MRIIPVIDILNSKVVHAIAGEREKYAPLKTVLTDDPTPINLVNTFIDKLGAMEVYIADLDSIINNKPNITIIKDLLNNSKINILLDPGIKSKSDLLHYSQIGIYKIIVGTETIKDLGVIEKAIDIFGKNRTIVSLDMKNEKILTNCQEILHLTPIQTVLRLQEIGVKEIILLDLSRVGKKIGFIPESYIDIQNNSDISILIGGGIKNFKDVLEIEELKFSGILIATAIHQGLIQAHTIKQYIAKSTELI